MHSRTSRTAALAACSATLGLTTLLTAATTAPIARPADLGANDISVKPASPGPKLRFEVAPAYGGEDLAAALQAGAHYLRMMQADITEDNAGNGTDGLDESPDDPDDGGWDWVTSATSHSTGSSPTNIYGATAQGLYYAYLESGDASLFTALEDAANAMLANSDIDSSSDLVFLMEYDDLAGVTGTTYADAARAKYDNVIATTVPPTATGLAERIRDLRAGQGYENGIIPWDVGTWARVAAMLDARYPGNGYGTDAADIAEVLWQDTFNDSPGYFDLVDNAGYDPTYLTVDYYWYNLGITGLIQAFATSGTHTTDLPVLINRLLESQLPNGAISFHYGGNAGDEDWQSTAYSALALGQYDQATYQTELNLMGYFTAATQSATLGGWVYGSGDHYPEIGGENTASLYFTTLMAPGADISLDSTMWCASVDVGDTVVIDVDLTGAEDYVVGGQFWLEYDATRLMFVSATTGDAPFTREVIPAIDGAGTLFYAVGVPDGDDGTLDDTTMARLTFEVIGEACSEPGLVAFAADMPPLYTAITNEAGIDLTASRTDLGARTVDDTPPMITSCPSSIGPVYADAGLCSASVAFPDAVATDNCGLATVDPITYWVGATQITSPYVFPAGTTTTVDVVAIDECGNTSTCNFDVTVLDSSALIVDVAFSGADVGTTVDRCISFTVADCTGATSASFDAVLTFVDGVALGAVVDVPCGDWECISAGDALHTLRSTDNDDFGIAGLDYVASFVDNTGTSGDDDTLRSGNLNGDTFVDILDFGLYVGQVNTFYDGMGGTTTAGSESGDTLCGDYAVHADLSGNGLVFSEDFAALQPNFLAVDEAMCCSGASPASLEVIGRRTARNGVGNHASGPIARISVAELIERGLDDLVAADLNRDGWLDQQDVIEFINGSMP